ncbi:MAG: hypothetical protein K0R59_3977 [Sphingobacterium sp.]|jgi:hypothetical protein|nr:hypothetical protein [Sphingobacterium sp.]
MHASSKFFLVILLNGDNNLFLTVDVVFCTIWICCFERDRYYKLVGYGELKICVSGLRTWK